MVGLPFEVENFGKCDTCKEDRSLDSMIRKNYKKGLYHCVDCETDFIENRSFNTFFSDGDMEFKQPVLNKLKKMLIWCFG